MPTRVSEEGLSKLKARVGLLKRSIDRWSVLEEDQDRKAYVMLRESIESAIEYTRSQLELLAERPNKGQVQEDRDNMVMLGGQLSAYKNILTDMKSPRDKMERAKAELIELREKISKVEDGQLV